MEKRGLDGGDRREVGRRSIYQALRLAGDLHFWGDGFGGPPTTETVEVKSEDS